VKLRFLPKLKCRIWL